MTHTPEAPAPLRGWFLAGLLSLSVVAGLFALPLLLPEFVSLAQPLLCRPNEIMKVTQFGADSLLNLGYDVVCYVGEQYREVNHWYTAFTLFFGALPLIGQLAHRRRQETHAADKRKREVIGTLPGLEAVYINSDGRVQVSHHVMQAIHHPEVADHMADIQADVRTSLADGHLDAGEMRRMMDNMQGLLGAMSSALPADLATGDTSREETLRQLQESLDAGLINQEEYDDTLRRLTK